MGCFKFFSTNFIDFDILANTDVSSEQAAFPVENAYNGKRRAKVWRSDGYYVVDSTNNGIVFRETTAVDLTATIVVGEYSRSAFLTAIKTALEATGASTYTVTFTTDFKINIASNGAGGGGILELVMDDVGSTAYEILGFDQFEYTGALSYEADSISIHYPNEFILWDLGIDSNPAAFALIDARNSPLSISPTAVVTLQGNHTNTWTTPAYEQVLTYDDRILKVLDENGLAQEQLRYWRVTFEDQNPLGYVQVGAFYLGGMYSPANGTPQFPFRQINVDRSETVYSEGGQTFSEEKQKTERFAIDWRYLSSDEKEDMEDLFQKFGTHTPFFISMDTSEYFSTTQAEFIRYVKFIEEPTFELFRAGLWSGTLTFEEQL